MSKAYEPRMTEEYVTALGKTVMAHKDRAIAVVVAAIVAEHALSMINSDDKVAAGVRRILTESLEPSADLLIAKLSEQLSADAPDV